MSQQQYFLPRGAALRMPSNVTRVADPKTGRPRVIGTNGPMVVGPAQLDASFVQHAMKKVEGNGRTLLENLLAAGTVVTEAGTTFQVEIAPALPHEVEMTKSPNENRR